MAQATQNRPSSESRWSLRPPQVRLSRTSAGALLALSAWLFQSYLGSLDASRMELRDALRSAQSRRETWLIEYNSSLLRPPQKGKERVTARAALELAESTRECLAIAEAVQKSPLSLGSTAPEADQEDTADARTLFEERKYRDLQKELEAVTTAYESLQEGEQTAGSPSKAGFVWWRHAVPLAFLIGIGLCISGGSAATDD